MLLGSLEDVDCVPFSLILSVWLLYLYLGLEIQPINRYSHLLVLFFFFYHFLYLPVGPVHMLNIDFE